MTNTEEYSDISLEDIKGKQRMLVNDRIEKCSRTRYCHVVKRHADGALVIHHFYRVRHKWHGHVETIGIRGGCESNYNYRVDTTNPQALVLVYSPTDKGK